ncbi:MAG: hypothetical protein M3Y59_05130 [Myxococcota bacterium]|nr:hypothetical protein [Myxococcota bacterium]
MIGNEKQGGEEHVPRVDLQSADSKTLRLSVPVVTAERLDQLIRFQQRLVVELRALPSNEESTAAKAHQAAVAASGINARIINELEALVRVFSGRRWTVRKLEQRLLEARAHLAQAEASGAAPSPKEVAAVAKLPKEIALKQDPSALEARYGAEALGLLDARADELLALHEELTALQRR